MYCEAVGVGVQICLALVDTLHYCGIYVSGLHKIVSETVFALFVLHVPIIFALQILDLPITVQVSMIESFAHRIDVSFVFAFAHGLEGSELFGTFLT